MIGINDTKDNATGRYAGRHIFIVMLNVIMLNVVILNVVVAVRQLKH